MGVSLLFDSTRQLLIGNIGSKTIWSCQKHDTINIDDNTKINNVRLLLSDLINDKNELFIKVSMNMTIKIENAIDWIRWRSFSLVFYSILRAKDHWKRWAFS